METRKIGSLDVSVVGLGCNNFGRRIDFAQTQEVVNTSLEEGINFFDTADIYGDGQSEEYLGRALGARRNEVIIATKFGSRMEGQGEGASAAYIRQAVEASLRRLGMERIDLYQLHVPDPATPIAETLGALADLVREGKVREIGCSNFSLEQLQEAEAAAREAGVRFVSVQNEYSLLHRKPEADVLPFCEEHGIAFLPYFPLASGMLTGKYRRGEPLPEGTRISNNPTSDRWLNEANLERVERLIPYVEGHGHSILDLAFSWLLRWGSVASVIAGATKPSQVRANAAAAGWKLTEAELGRIEAL